MHMYTHVKMSLFYLKFHENNFVPWIVQIVFYLNKGNNRMQFHE